MCIRDSTGTVNEPTRYHISIACSKYIANIIDIIEVNIKLHWIYLTEKFLKLLFSILGKSLPIVYAEIKVKLSIVEDTIANREIIKSPLLQHQCYLFSVY